MPISKILIALLIGLLGIPFLIFCLVSYAIGLQLFYKKSSVKYRRLKYNLIKYRECKSKSSYGVLQVSVQEFLGSALMFMLALSSPIIIATFIALLIENA